MNKVTMIGRLKADPEIRQAASGVLVAAFRVVTPPTNGNEQPDEFRCRALRRVAETLQAAKGGNRIALVGRLQLHRYTNEAGEAKTAVQILCEEVEVMV